LVGWLVGYKFKTAVSGNLNPRVMEGLMLINLIMMMVVEMVVMSCCCCCLSFFCAPEIHT
jgi:hypothetical protein